MGYEEVKGNELQPGDIVVGYTAPGNAYWELTYGRRTIETIVDERSQGLLSARFAEGKPAGFFFYPEDVVRIVQRSPETVLTVQEAFDRMADQVLWTAEGEGVFAAKEELGIIRKALNLPVANWEPRHDRNDTNLDGD